MTGPRDNDQESGSLQATLQKFFGVFRYSREAMQLVWQTSQKLTLALMSLTLLAGVLPGATAYISKLIVDSVLDAAKQNTPEARWTAFSYVIITVVLVVALTAAQRGITICQSLLRALLGHRVNLLILEKAQELSLSQFEDAEFYDKMTRARREASRRPLSLVTKTFGLIQNGITLSMYGVLLLQFSWWAVLILILAALPSFIAEAKFSGEAFRLFRWRVPETRQQSYLEMLLAREDFAKEVKLFGLGEIFLKRYTEIFKKLYSEDRDLTIRRGFWGFVLGLLSTLTFYAAYAWIVWATIIQRISIGEMTMYILVFRQGQSAISAVLSSVGQMYEDNLYLSNLYEFLETEAPPAKGDATEGPSPGDGVRFEHVSFAYPGNAEPALEDVSFHIKPGQKLALVGENGSGKTTLIKLLTRLYEPTSGKITLDGLDLQDWDVHALQQRIGVIFQDFVRYQFIVGENIGVGQQEVMQDEEAWKQAAEKGMADVFIDKMPDGYQTQLGRWFKDGRELSLGQWQKIALSRAFVRESADIIVLDEPTASMDAEAEATIFARFRELTKEQMAILISHRFSTVRMADYIVVLHHGRVIEAGSHEALLEQDGRYAHLFTLQAAGYV
ncbi:MAG: ABC transporter permease [Deltaproteobacteria bacterium]|nr:ABC transporter permease [Deltaproteobacteria bacterium]|tara:strand:- start:45525 stop:47369 length:1845 start_codon:yes stop_codon:yes gene_type:complete